jgi:hypothetical protein
MKRLLLFLAILLYIPYCKAQDADEYVQTDRLARQIPDSVTTSIATIARYITGHFQTKVQKVRAAYAWVTTNIKYDKDSMYSINWAASAESKITVAMRRRKGVCENFASIFTGIVRLCGIRSYVVDGYTKQQGQINRNGHSWCAVELGLQWFFCDPTWDEKYKQANYFLVPPEVFIQTHMPFDPLWQLLSQPISYQSFSSGHYLADENYVGKEMLDSVNVFLSMNELEQMQETVRRIRQAGFYNELIRTRHAYLAMQIAIILEDKDKRDYDSAVYDLQLATRLFNEFIEYRNNRFIPNRTDAELANLLKPVEKLLNSTLLHISTIGTQVENLQWDTGGMRQKIGQLQSRISEQQRFIQQYIHSPNAEREKLFFTVP